jgi:hypothetical protein
MSQSVAGKFILVWGAIAGAVVLAIGLYALIIGGGWRLQRTAPAGVFPEIVYLRSRLDAEPASFGNHFPTLMPHGPPAMRHRFARHFYDRFRILIGYAEARQRILTAFGTDLDDMDCAEALVFWLAGPSNPKGKGNRKLAGFASAPAHPLCSKTECRRRDSSYGLDDQRLVDRDGDGWWEYLPAEHIGSQTAAPFVYFDAASYGGARYPHSRLGPNEKSHPVQWNVCRPRVDGAGEATTQPGFLLIRPNSSGVYDQAN